MHRLAQKVGMLCACLVLATNGALCLFEAACGLCFARACDAMTCG